MKNYVIRKSDDKKEIIYYNYDLTGYNMKSKNNGNNQLKVDEIMIVKPSLVDKLITIKFKEKYKRLVMIVLSILHASDTSEGDCIIALDEVAKLKEILLYKYHNKIKMEKETMFLEQLEGLERSLSEKLIQIRAFNNMFNFENEQEKSKGR
ncbi:MAG: hypothetical protein IJO33_05000 [Bacilli bacterium]|nr:hypothetical protein [Bacilli bacterium]